MRPPGTSNGMPPLRTSRRRSSAAARQHAAYTSSTVTFAATASTSNRPNSASAATIALCAAIATCGVRHVGCTRASADGRNPSRPNANSMRGTASVMPLTYANIDTVEPTRIIVRPAGPSATPAADASGVGSFGSAAPSSPCATIWMETYSSATTVIATKIARGTVRAGSRTSPLGTSALSTPRKAKMSRTDARDTAVGVGVACQTRLDHRIVNRPTTTSSTSGSSFAAVATALKRVTPPTPRMFAAASSTSTPMSATCRPVVPSAGTSASSESAKKVETAASARVIPTHRSAPETKPTNGPNAVSTYA